MKKTFLILTLAVFTGLIIGTYTYIRDPGSPSPQTSEPTMKPQHSQTPFTDAELKAYWNIFTTDPKYRCIALDGKTSDKNGTIHAKPAPGLVAQRFSVKGTTTTVGANEVFECLENLWVF